MASCSTIMPRGSDTSCDVSSVKGMVWPWRKTKPWIGAGPEFGLGLLAVGYPVAWLLRQVFPPS